MQRCNSFQEYQISMNHISLKELKAGHIYKDHYQKSIGNFYLMFINHQDDGRYQLVFFE